MLTPAHGFLYTFIILSSLLVLIYRETVHAWVDLCHLEEVFGRAFPGPVLGNYRETMGETAATAPLASRVYADAILLAGVGVARRITGLPADRLLREFGRYFLTNGLTQYLYAYLLTQVHGGRDLLLAMQDAHEQMSRRCLLRFLLA